MIKKLSSYSAKRVSCVLAFLSIFLCISCSKAAMAQNDTGRVIAGPLSDFLTEQQISELSLSDERTANAYSASSPFFELANGVNPVAEIVSFFQSTCPAGREHTLYVSWKEQSKRHNARFEIAIEAVNSDDCQVVSLDQHDVELSTIESFDTTLSAERIYLTGFQDRKANKNRRFEARLMKNDLGQFVELHLFEDRRIRTIFGELWAGLNGGTRIPGWDGKNVLRYNFVLGVGYLF